MEQDSDFAKMKKQGLCSGHI